MKTDQPCEAVRCHSPLTWLLDRGWMPGPESGVSWLPLDPRTSKPTRGVENEEGGSLILECWQCWIPNVSFLDGKTLEVV